MQDLILEVSELIAKYNKPLSVAFINQPFNRVNLARAFSRGFVKNVEDDAPNFCYTIVRIAMLDKECRKSA